MAPIESHRTVTRDDTAQEILARIEQLFPWATVDYDFDPDWQYPLVASDDPGYQMRPADLDTWSLSICIDDQDDRAQYNIDGTLADLVAEALPLIRSLNDTDGIEWARLRLSGWALLHERGFEL